MAIVWQLFNTSGQCLKVLSWPDLTACRLTPANTCFLLLFKTNLKHCDLFVPICCAIWTLYGFRFSWGLYCCACVYVCFGQTCLPHSNSDVDDDDDSRSWLHLSIKRVIQLSIYLSIYPSIHLCNAASHAAQLADPHDAFVCRLWLSLSHSLADCVQLACIWLNKQYLLLLMQLFLLLLLLLSSHNNYIKLRAPIELCLFWILFFTFPPLQPFAMHCINHPHRRLYKLICYA